MAFTHDDIRKLEALAALELGSAERERLRADLQRILEYVRRLQAIDVAGVPPTTHVVAGDAALRQDQVVASYPPDEILRNAPDRKDQFYRVPRFVGEGDAS